MITSGAFQQLRQSRTLLLQRINDVIDTLTLDGTLNLPAFLEHLVDLADSLDALEDELDEFSANIHTP